MIWLLLAISLAVLPVQAATIGTHAAVTNITLKQIISKQRLRFTWDKVSTARRYRVKVLHNQVRIARKTVQRRRVKFPETKFQDGETYTVLVRAKPNAQYARTAWTRYTFTFGDLDHDNDLIPDELDSDDDNDGIPDAQDSAPTDVSGTVYTVQIDNNTFVAGTISVLENDSVTWVNKDVGGHSVAANDGSWASPPLEPNESYTHSFPNAGVFSYYDPTYPDISAMTGTITVYAE